MMSEPRGSTRRRRRRAAAMAAAISVLLVPSCSRVVDDARAVAAEPGQVFGTDASEQACTPVDAELVDVPSPAGSSRDTGPVLRVPKPDGWNRITALDSVMIRYVMRNDDLAVDGLAPTAVVTLEALPRKVAPQDYFDEQKRQVSELGDTELMLTDTTLCGLPAVRGSYMSSLLGTKGPRRADLVSAVMYVDGVTYGVALTVQSADEEDPVFVTDSRQILDGFQVLPPGSG